jgi:hypothetical protein
MSKPRLLLLAALLASPLRAEVPALLNDALNKVVHDHGRWAYTESYEVRNGKNKVIDANVVRFDPSKPYPEQFTPITVDGHLPSRSDLEKYRDRGIKRGHGLEKAESEGKPPPGRTLGDEVDLTRATVAQEDATTVTYEVPLRADNNERFPPDKFQVLVRVDKAGRALQHVAVHLRAPMRFALLLKVKSGELDVEFAQVDAKHAPAMTRLAGGGTASVVFISLGRSFVITRSAFQHVRPFDERFGTEIGPMKALDF